MVRVGFHYDARYRQWFEAIFDLSDLLKDLGVELLNEPAEPVDLRIVHSSIYHQQKEAKGGEEPYPGPLVIWERVDQETVNARNRNLIKLPHVVGWLKDHDIRDKALNNAPHVYGYWHYGLVAHDPQRYPAKIPDVILTPEDLSKITCLNNLAGYRTRFASYRAMDPLPQKARDIDVCFAGTVAYREMMRGSGGMSHEILYRHRAACSHAMGRLVKHKTLLATNHILSDEEYRDVLSRSKIVVSPYGYSMSSWKDWEAIYSGAILIKPDSHQQVNYLPDLFEDPSRYVICEPNFEDLESRVDEVLSDYDTFWQRTMAARDALLTCRDKGRRAYDFHTQVLSWLNKAPSIDFPAFVGRLPYERRMLIDRVAVKRDDRTRVPAAQQVVVGAAAPNLLSDTVDFSKPYWSVVRATLREPMVAPTGHIAHKLVEDRTLDTHDIRRVADYAEGGGRLAVSFIAKPAERSGVHLWLGQRGLSKRVQTTFDLKHGVAWSEGTDPEWQPLQQGMTRLPDGWWWCWLTAELPDVAQLEMMLAAAGPAGQIGYKGDGESGLWAGAPRIEPGSVATLEMANVGRPPAAGSSDAVAKLGKEFARYYEEYPQRRSRLGFHSDYYLSRLMFHLLDQAETFIETGTSSGDSIVYVARNYPGYQCYSCDAKEQNIISSARRVAAGNHTNVELHVRKSPDFLYDLVRRSPDLATKRTVFWLDAHGHDFPCPLADEVAFITERFPAAAIAIDDFQVPGKPRFGFDTYKDAALTWDYIAPALAADTRYQVIRPDYELHTSLHHPPRGWIVITKSDWVPVPPGLETVYAVSTMETQESARLRMETASR